MLFIFFLLLFQIAVGANLCSLRGGKCYQGHQCEPSYYPVKGACSGSSRDGEQLCCVPIGQNYDFSVKSCKCNYDEFQEDNHESTPGAERLGQYFTSIYGGRYFIKYSKEEFNDDPKYGHNVGRAVDLFLSDSDLINASYHLENIGMKCSTGRGEGIQYIALVNKTDPSKCKKWDARNRKWEHFKTNQPDTHLHIELSLCGSQYYGMHMEELRNSIISTRMCRMYGKGYDCRLDSKCVIGSHTTENLCARQPDDIHCCKLADQPLKIEYTDRNIGAKNVYSSDFVEYRSASVPPNAVNVPLCDPGLRSEELATSEQFSKYLPVYVTISVLGSCVVLLCVALTCMCIKNNEVEVKRDCQWPLICISAPFDLMRWVREKHRDARKKRRHCSDKKDNVQTLIRTRESLLHAVPTAV